MSADRFVVREFPLEIGGLPNHTVVDTIRACVVCRFPLTPVGREHAQARCDQMNTDDVRERDTTLDDESEAA